jgi:hypothetical protein
VFFYNEGRAAGALATRKWMYELGGSLIVAEDDSDTLGLAFLMLGSSPRVTSTDRDKATDNYCRFFTTLRTITAGRSDFFAQALDDAATPADEVAEYVADI